MNLRSSNPYWLYHSPLLYTYTAIEEDLKTDIAIVGAGISGALVAYSLVKEGFKVAIISKDHVGTESTCASTSLLQYEIDTPLSELTKRIGREKAERSYWLCHDAIDELETIHGAMGLRKVFERKKSLQLASSKKDVKALEVEYHARIRAGIEVKLLSDEEVKEQFGFQAPAALYSSQAAQHDAYLLTQKLIRWCADHGAVVFDKTEIKNVISHSRSVELITSGNLKVKARHAVMATGYEAVKWIEEKIARLHSTYAIISEPFREDQLWEDECLIWETSDPYNYLRATSDHRIIIGGKDEMFSSAGKRDRLLYSKSKQLLNAFHRLFPHLKFTVEFAWAGTFADTPDGLPYIGIHQKMPHVYFALGFGGNGITFSQVAANLIRDMITRKRNPDQDIFTFDRLNV